MNQLKTALILISVFVFSSMTNAQSKVKVPEELHGFWHFKVDNPNAWDGTSIGEGYVEFFYKYFYVEEIKKTGKDNYHLKLFHSNGQKMELTISELSNQQAKLQFSGWSQPKVCQRLEYAVGTDLKDIDELPEYLFQEWTDNNQGTVFCKISKDGALTYNGRDWNIEWASWHNEKEYRLFICHKDLYQMLYIHKLEPKTMIMAGDLGRSVLYPVAANKAIYKILGNWAETESNNWKLGFFEEFAIYNSDFWEYESMHFKGNKGKIVLKKGDETVGFKLKFSSDSLCNIAINTNRAKSFFKCGKTLPAYSTPDTTAFMDTKFEFSDTVTIKGYLRHNTHDKPYSLSFHNPITGDHDEYFADIDSLGRFTIRFPLINTTQIYLDWGRMTKVDVAEPGETYFIGFDFGSGQHLIMGDNERLHNELTDYAPYWGNFNKEDYQKQEAMTPMEYLEYQKEFLNTRYDHLNKYIADHPLVSDRFKYCHRNNYRFEAAFDLMQRRFNLNRREGERFPAGFMEYVNDSLYNNNPVIPCTLVRGYLWFMRDYVGYIAEARGSSSVSIVTLDAIIIMKNEGLLKLTDEEEQLFVKHNELSQALEKLIKEKADSLKIAEVFKPYGAVNEKIHHIAKRSEVQDFINDLLSKKSVQSEFAKIDSLITDPLIKDMFEARWFYQQLNWKQTALSEETMDIFRDRVVIPALKEYVLNLQDHYFQLSKQDIRYTESLKNTDHLKDAKDADTLFAQLTDPYRGKIVYIDIWGTWCGPCKQQMKYVGEVKEALKDKEVIFMYFANNSPEESWENVIKVNQLTGENIVHYRLPDKQQAMIERRLSIRSYPTYILMDKAGNIVNMKAPRPQLKEELIEEINKLLIL